MTASLIDIGALGALTELAFLTGPARAKLLQLLDERGVFPFAYIERVVTGPTTHDGAARIKLSDEFHRVLAAVRAVKGDCDPLVKGTMGVAQGEAAPS